MTTRPPLSVVVPTRLRFSSLGAVLDVLVPQVRALGGEVVVVGGGGEDGETPPPGARFVPMHEDDILRLRARALSEVDGDVIAIGEDHAFPDPGWAEAVVRAHLEHPKTPVILGCLANITAKTSAARANFLAFAAPFSQPMTEIVRPPPTSVVSIKRDALTRIDGTPGRFETELLPRLFEEGGMVADDRILVGHHQDYGVVEAMRNAFVVARTSYGYASNNWSHQQRRTKARYALGHIAPLALSEARARRTVEVVPRRDLLVVALIGAASALGAAVGALAGAGRAPLHSS